MSADRAAVDAVAQQHLLYDNLSKPIMAEVLRQLVEEQRRVNSRPADRFRPVPAGRHVAEGLREILSRAETYWVSRDMTQVMLHAAQGLDELDRFGHELWPTDAGFLLFEQPWHIQDVRGKQIGCKAVLWWRQSIQMDPGTSVAIWSDRDDPDDDVSRWLIEENHPDDINQVGRLQPSEIGWIADGMRVGPARLATPEHYPDAEPGPWPLVAESDNANRHLLALLMLLGQTIVAKSRHNLMPANPKRARRIPIPAQVTVIRLRRESGVEPRPGESTVEWHHRWVVRGHWRSQRCGPDYPLAQEIAPGQFRARIYIAPFIKGPEGLPIVITDKVQALVR